MGGDLQPGCLAIGSERKRKSIVLLRKEIMNKLVVDLLQQKGLGC
jgi:hypothetical protein